MNFSVFTEDILLCILFLVFWIFLESEQSVCTDLKNFNNLNKTYKPSGPLIHGSVVGGLLHCVEKCKTFKGCKLFAFNIERQTCGLYFSYESSITALTNREGNLMISARKDWQVTPDADATNKEGVRKLMRGYDCFILDKIYLKDFYNGTVIVTKSGKTCQRWDSAKPHKHVFHGSSDRHFSNTGESLADVANYCRMTTSERERAPWCYTTDSSTRWENCNVTECP